ncbi:hypothetical protein [Candidatus Hoaglandella endobia]|nr:hypothetical protein [Candidatus Hoaglandella endobia]
MNNRGGERGQKEGRRLIERPRLLAWNADRCNNSDHQRSPERRCLISY